jgi:hypothetical protein
VEIEHKPTDESEYKPACHASLKRGRKQKKKKNGNSDDTFPNILKKRPKKIKETQGIVTSRCFSEEFMQVSDYSACDAKLIEGYARS